MKNNPTTKFYFKVGLLKQYYYIRWRLWELQCWLFRITHKKLFLHPEKYIPKNTYYCYTDKGNCPFWRRIKFLHKRMNGYCHYLGKADIDINPEKNKHMVYGYSINDDVVGKTVAEVQGKYFPSSLLWDQCKECDVE